MNTEILIIEDDPVIRKELHAKSNTNDNRYSSHQKSFSKKEPTDCFLLHPHNRLYCKFLLPTPQHIVIYIAYQEQ